MIRPIKFRAWDTRCKKMRIGLILYCYKDGSLGIEPLGDNIGHYHYSSEFKLMQFTGKLDKNGKEIYEGDVVKWFEYYSSGKRTEHYSVIRWDENRAGWRFDDLSHFWCELEVIGNIYENTELILKSPS